MIDSAIGYKFRDHISETVLYEDQIVEHILTGHVSERRVFPKRMTQDQTAYEMIQKQLKMAAKIEHPNLPSIYGSTTHQNQFLYIQQHFGGETLELLATRKHAQKAKDWIEIATRLADLCHDLQFQGVAFDRLSLRDIIISNRLLLINRRYPVGKTSEEAQRSSPYLSRLFESDTSGIYHSEGRFPTQTCLVNLKNMLFQLACSRRHQTIEEAREHINERNVTSGRKSVSVLGIEHTIEDIILRMDEPSSAKAIRSIDDLKAALAEFDIHKPEPTIKASVSSVEVRTQQVVPNPSDSKISDSPAFPDGNPVERSMAEAEMPSTVQLNRPSRTPARKEPTTAKPEPEEKPAHIKRAVDSKMTGHSLDDDAEEDRSYLYPSKQKQSGSSDVIKKDSRTSGLASKDEILGSGSKTQIRKKDPVKIPWVIIGGVVVVGLVAFGVMKVLPLLESETNTAPVVNIKQPESLNVPVQQFIIVDASGSSDPEEDTLKFNWSLPDVEDDTDYLIEYLESDRSVIQIKFFSGGTYGIRLNVFDGQLRSDTSEIVFEAYNP